jgi:hypothetical protein
LNPYPIHLEVAVIKIKYVKDCPPNLAVEAPTASGGEEPC